LGITLEHLIAQTTNEEYVAGEKPILDTLIFKLVSLRNLAVYWNSGDLPLKPDSSAPCSKDKLLSMIYRGDTIEERNAMGLTYILKPVSAEVKLRINKSNVPDADIPKYTADIHVGDISATLSESQFKDLKSFIDWMELLEKATRVNQKASAIMIDLR